jgi:hypothetical protein
MRFKFDNRKSQKLKSDPRRQVDLVEIQEIWSHPHYIDSRCDDPEQFRAIGWVKETSIQSYMKSGRTMRENIITL